MIDLSVLPDSPGCYLFSDSEGTIIYVGKAKNLRRRVGSYFGRHDHDPKTEVMVEHITSLDFIATDTEVEALLLENTLIKKHRPRYNIDLRDSRNYAYIHLSGEKFPGIGIARKRDASGKYFGPFVSAGERDEVLAFVKKTFRLRSCRHMPKRPCLRYHLSRCSGPCTGAISPEEYNRQVRMAESVLDGNTSELIASMEEEMRARSAETDFEKAMELRDQISALSALRESQHVARQKRWDEDILNYEIRDNTVWLMLFHVHLGTLTGKQEFVFRASENPVEEFIVQYYAENEPPAELIVPEMPDEALTGYLSHLRGKKVRVVVPKRGEKRDLLRLVSKNIMITFFGGEAKVEELRKRLHLRDAPEVIECFDISHLAGTSMVGSMVQFRHGRPDSQNYRHFRIRTVSKIDDYASIAEVVHRRYSRLLREEAEMPDLIIIDGGRGQLSAAEKVLCDLNLEIPVISIAKKQEEIYAPGLSHPLPIARNEKASLFVQEIRDEAHRFAITYNRRLHRKEIIP